MASDGSQRLFYPTPGGAPVPASHSAAVAPAASAQRRAATGVWDGPAPKGWSAPGATTQAAAEVTFNPAKEPRSVLLANGVRLPLLGVAAADAAGVERACLTGCLLVEPGCEVAVGAALRAALASTPRDSVFIAAVLPGAPQDAAAVRRSFDGLLAALGVTHLDLVLLDWSAAAAGASDVLPSSVAAAWAGVEALLDAQAARAAGVAHAGWRGLDALLGACRLKPVVNAAELHPLLPQRKMCGFARRKGVELLALAPLALGAPALLQHPTVLQLAAAHQKTATQVVLRYNVQRGVAVMPAGGAAPAEELAGVFAFQVSYAQKVLMDTLDNGTRVLAPAPGCTFPADD